MGSKRKLAKPIVDYILLHNPNCKYIYDLFSGGGAISFECLQRKQIQQVTYNELNTGVVELLKKIKTDGVTDEFYQWVDRETFFKNKDGDDWFSGLCKTIWSFGNRGDSYLFGKHIEELKRQVHELVVNGIPFNVGEFKIDSLEGSTINDRRLHFKQIIRSNKTRFDLQQLESLERLQQLERLQRLQQLERLQQLQRLEILNQSAFDVNIKTPIDETIIYLDPPYQLTASYQKSICYDELNNYIKNSKYKIYLSSYESDFPLVYEMRHRSTLSATVNDLVIEKLFCNQPSNAEIQSYENKDQNDLTSLFY